MYGMGLSFYQLPWQIRGCSHHLIPRIPTPDTHYYHFPPPRKPTKLGTLTPLLAVAASGGNGNNGGGWNNPFNFGSGSFGWWSGNGDSSSGFENVVIALFLTWVSAQLAAAAASSCQFVWEVKGGKRRRFIVDSLKDEFLEAPESSSFSFDILTHLLLPEGFPHSVTSDYLQYSIWRGFQGIASQLTSVLATQSLLYAVGLGKGAIPTAAALNWVLKDGFGYLSKILFSKYGRHFDVNPKPWRLFADLLENAAFGLEMLTPAFPHHFLLIGAAAGAGRSAAALIQAATRSCFYAGFAAQRNFAEVIAKGEAQGMVSKSIGILLGIALANHISSSTSLALGCFSVVTLIHMFCNLKSYKSIELRTLNPYRASLVFSEYLVSGEVPPLKDVNNEEPLFPDVPFLNTKLPYGESRLGILSIEAKDAAAKIEKRLQLGSKLSDVVSCEEDVRELFSLYKNENYILAEHRGSYCVVLKENASPGDMLKALFHVNYLHWLERNAGITARSASDDCRPGGRLQMSLEYVQREFDHFKYDGELAGWLTDGLIARPLGNRICPGYETT